MKNNLSKSVAAFAAFSILLSLLFIFVMPAKHTDAASGKTITLSVKKGADITASLQKALTDAVGSATKKKPVTVKVPAGTYYISDTIFISSNTKLVLDKKTVIKKSSSSKTPVAYMLRCAGNPAKRGCTSGGYSDSANITISGGTWDADFVKCNDDSSGSVFSFSHTTNLTVSGVTIRNCYGTHLIELSAAKKVTIKGCELYGFKSADPKTEKEAIQLDVCHDEKLMPSGAPYDDTPCTKITISKCSIHDYPRAIGSHIMVDRIYHKSIKIANNNIYNISGAAVYGCNYVSLTISKNTIKNVGCAIQLKSDTDVSAAKRERLKGVKAMSLSKSGFNITVSGNTIETALSGADKDDSKSLIGIFLYGSEKAPINNVTISQNMINSASSGIYLRFVKNAKISSNRLVRSDNAFDVGSTSFSEDAVKLASSTVTKLSDNEISSFLAPFENGIALRDGSIVKDSGNNTVSYVTDCALALYSGSSFAGSKFICRQSGKHGITLDASDATLTDSSVTDAVQNGVTLKDNSQLMLGNSSISLTQGHGISMMSGSSLEMNDSTVSQSIKNGINASSSTLVLRSSLIDTCTGKGLSISSSSVADISGTVFTGNTDTALKSDGSELTLSGCTFSDNASTALRVTASKIDARSNCFTDNAPGEKVIFISDKSSGSLVDCSLSNPAAKRDILISANSNIIN